MLHAVRITLLFGSAAADALLALGLPRAPAGHAGVRARRRVYKVLVVGAEDRSLRKRTLAYRTQSDGPG